MKIISKILLFITIIISGCTFQDNNPLGNTDTSFPHTPTPSNSAVNQPNALRLEWKIDQANSNDIYLGTSNPPTTLYATNRTVQNITVAGLTRNTRYYWRVIATLSDGTKKVGPVWNFTTSSSGSSGQLGNLLINHKIFTEDPSLVNIWFQVLDYDGKGINGLTTNDFNLYEDGKIISASESKMEVIKKTDVPYILKVVLMLDNSSSIGIDINEVKNAALQFVSNLIPGGQAQVAIFVFSEKPRMIQDFTDNLGLLNSAINSIVVEFPTTDLFGAVIEGVNQWTDKYDITQVEQGTLVLFTDGTDTQGRHSLSEALASRGNKKVYTVGLGTEISPDTLTLLGNAGFYSSSDAAGLGSAFLKIQQELIDYGNSFYWLRYLSPKRGNNDHIIELKLKNNLNTGAGSSIVGNFNSSSFYSTQPGIYIGANNQNPFGVDTVFIGKYGETLVTAQAILLNNPPQFNWSPADTNIAIVYPLGGDNSQARIRAKGTSSVTSTLITDSNNSGLSKRLYIKVR